MEITINWRFIVGIDVSKKKLDIYLLDRKPREGESLEVPNTPRGFSKLRRWLKDSRADKSEVVLVSEHTGRYGERLLRWTTETDWPHAVVKTTALEKVSWEHPRKTDEFDAEKLADYGRRFEDRLRLSEASKPAVSQIKRAGRWSTNGPPSKASIGVRL
jgi:transposase